MAGCGVLMPLMFVSSWCCGNERVHGEWLLLMRVDAIEVHLERVLVEWSICMGNGWFRCVVISRMCVSSGFLWN